MMDIQTTCNDSSCDGLDYEYHESFEYTREGELFEYVTEGILLTMFSVVGLIGNVLALYVLQEPIYDRTFSNILITLTSFDALFLSTLPLTFGFPLLSTYYKVDSISIIISC